MKIQSKPCRFCTEFKTPNSKSKDPLKFSRSSCQADTSVSFVARDSFVKLRLFAPRRVRIDMHHMQHGVTVLIELPEGSIDKQRREFGGVKRDCRALVRWLTQLRVELVVMESIGIYWKSLYAHLKNFNIIARFVNAHFIMHVPGRKTDMLDSEWLAVLARFGLVHGSFIPPKIFEN